MLLLQLLLLLLLQITSMLTSAHWSRTTCGCSKSTAT
jgi:hypothetical protein